MSSPLTDLDELVLRCRNERAKSFIHEAVASYRAGAFRASIVATWIAVCFDFIDKLRELELAGDKEAGIHVARLEKIRESGDVAEALRFERDLLVIARDKFEWLSHIEYVDLERLRVDRNRCAHPSLVADGQAYAPSAELARLHISSAVGSVLQHPPAQGTYALKRLVRDVSSEYFPTKPDAAKATLQAGPLNKARESLVRNFVVVLLKDILLKEDLTFDVRHGLRRTSALRATQAMHPQQYAVAMKGRLSEVARQIQDGDLPVLIRFLREIPDSWAYLDADLSQKLVNYVRDLPTDEFSSVDAFLDIKELAEGVLERIRKATFKDITAAPFFALPSPVADRLVTLYLSARSFDSANRIAKEMKGYADDFSADQVTRILKRVKENPEIMGSFELRTLLTTLRGEKSLSSDAFDALVAEVGLEDYVRTDD